MAGRAGWERALAGVLERVLGRQQLNHLVRFEPVLGLVHRSSGGRILDVGSGSAGLTELLGPAWQTTALDVTFDDDGQPAGHQRRARVVGDARRLPMPDRAFDVTVAVDLLEHLRAEDRAQAVAELCRVAREQVLIACPTGAGAFDADRRIATRLASSGRGCPDWLEEHLDRGFSEPGDVVVAARPFGRVETWGNESIAAHEALVRAELSRLLVVPTRVVALLASLALRSGRGWPAKLAGKALRRLRGSDREPTYRTIVAVSVDDT